MMGAEMRHLIVIATLAACSDKSAPPAPSPPPEPPVVVNDAELAAWKQAVQDRVAANATRVCTRPVVRPPAVAAPARADQLAILDGKGPCIASETVTPACLTALHAAVTHSDACSPDQVGGPLRDLVIYQSFTKRLIATQDVWTLVEFVAHLQDLARGAVPTVVARDVDELMGEVLAALVEIAQHTKLPEELNAALASLQTAMPGVAESLAAQIDLEALTAPDLAQQTRAQTLATACPPTATLMQCLGKVTGDDAALVIGRARNVAHLAALQVLVAAQRMSNCPLPPQLASAPLYKTLLAPALLGAPLRIAGTPPRVAPPAFVTPLVEWNIVCP
jgi:hypothetical protein